MELETQLLDPDFVFAFSQRFQTCSKFFDNDIVWFPSDQIVTIVGKNLIQFFTVSTCFTIRKVAVVEDDTCAAFASDAW